MADSSISTSSSENSSKTSAQVIIVGAGPVGLLIALSLGKAGIDVMVIEAHHELLRTTRALVYMPVVIPVLKSLGILDTVLDEAYLNESGIFWRDIEGKELANLPIGVKSPNGRDANSQPDEFSGVLLMGQYRMAKVILAELSKYPSVHVRFGLRCVGIEDVPTSDQVKVMVHSPYQPGSTNEDSDFFLSAKYIIGTDGANSAVRRLSCIPFEGFTYADFRMIGSDVLYDFIEHEGYGPLNFIVHPEEWAVIASPGEDEFGNSFKTSKGRPLWRIAYVEDPHLSSNPEDILKRAYERTSKYMSRYRHSQQRPEGGSSTEYDFEIIRAEPYLMSQRSANVPYKGRVYLAGDALHSNNPIGGLGLTGGILDAFCYGNAFSRVLSENHDPALLKECALSRLNAWKSVTNNLSQESMRRLHSQKPEDVQKREGFFAKLNDTSDGGNARAAFTLQVASGFTNMMTDDFSGKAGSS